jgi:hypothetical protein
MEKYHATMSAGARRALTRRKNIFLMSQVAGRQTRLLKQRRYAKAATLFLKHPRLWAYRLGSIRKHIRLLFKRI